MAVGVEGVWCRRGVYHVGSGTEVHGGKGEVCI